MKMHIKNHWYYYVMISFILVVVTICSLFYVKAQTTSYYDTSNAPEFYGLTKAIVQKDYNFDITSAHLRIFAKDFEDGDLTDKIQVISNNVDTSVIGNYEVIYQITDSHNNTTSITVPVEVVDNGEGNYYERTVYSLPSVDHMNATGPRGNNMDRQITGLMLRANAKINVKKVSGPNVVGVSFADSSVSQKNTTINENWQEISLPKVNTLFVKTPYKATEPIVIAIQVPEGEDVIEMPYYHYKDNEIEFRAYWDSIVGESVGLIENQSVSFYILPIDKGGFRGFSSLDEGLEFFDKVMTEYDELLGLKYDPTNLWDQNVKTKYFMIGAGANNGNLAYYTTDAVVWAGSNTPTSNAFSVGWATLHEIAHGYQGGGLKEDSGMGLLEVSNNILGYYVQTKSELTPLFGGSNWLGEIADIEDAINQKRLKGTKFRNLGASEKLYVLVNLIDLYDYKEAYAAVASKVRELEYKGQSSAYNLAEKYTIAFHELYGVNVASYFEAWGENISQKVKKLVKDDKNVFMLNDITTDDLATQIKNELGKDGKYSLVTQDEIAHYNLQGTLKLKIQIQDINDLIGKEIILTNNGEKYSYKIAGSELNITLPIGAYEVTLPVPKKNIYSYSPYHSIQVISGKTTEYSFSYQLNEENNLIYDTELNLAGQMGNFAKISFTKDNIIINTYNAYTHGYFDSYAKIEILDLNDQVVFSREYPGKAYMQAALDQIPYQIGYKLVVTHTEGSGNRFTILHTLTGVTPTNLTKVNGVNTYIIGQYGLYQTEESYENYKSRIDEYANKLLKEMTAEELANKNECSIEKGILLASIYKLKAEDQPEYLEKYRYIYNGSSPKLLTDTLTLKVGDTVNLYQTLKATDVEDGEFTLNNTNFSFDDFSTEQAGIYSIHYMIQDLDFNKSYGTLTITVENNIPSDEENNTPNIPDNSNSSENISNSTENPMDQANSSNNNNTESNNTSSNNSQEENVDKIETSDKEENIDQKDVIENSEKETEKNSFSSSAKIIFIILIVIIGIFIIIS